MIYYACNDAYDYLNEVKLRFKWGEQGPVFSLLL